MPELVDTEVDATPTDLQVQQLISAEKGHRGKGIPRTWRAPVKEPNDHVILVVDAAGGIAMSRDGGVTTPSPVIVDGTAAGGVLSGTYPNPGYAGAGPVGVGSPAGGDLTGTYPNPTLAPATVAALVALITPAGMVMAYAGAAVPAGWLVCDGTVVGRTDHPALFAAIGTTYNTGGESGAAFRLPDFRGRVLLGAGPGHPLGTRGGTETPLPHTHPGSHTHGLNHHRHDTDLAHDHFPAGTVRPIGTSVPVGINGLATTGGVNLPTTTHYHTFDVPAVPTPTLKASLDPSPAVTDPEGITVPADYGAASALPPFATTHYIIRGG